MNGQCRSRRLPRALRAHGFQRARLSPRRPSWADRPLPRGGRDRPLWLSLLHGATVVTGGEGVREHPDSRPAKRCGDSNGDFTCELHPGHDGNHEASMGFGWLTWRPAAVRAVAAPTEEES